jgi:4-hydroxy-2-oxoglutarate aldolase
MFEGLVQMNVLMDGIHIPLTAPFYRDGASYLRKLEHNVRRYSLTPAAGFVALASEGSSLSDEEVRETLQIVGSSAGAEKVLVAAIAKDSVRGALWIAEQAESAGFDAVMLAAPKDADVSETMVYLRAVADASTLPVMLFSEGLDVAAIGELAQHGNIVGAYDAGMTVERYRAIAAITSHVKREVTVTPVFAPVTRRMKAPTVEGSATFVTAESLAGGAALAVAPPLPALKTRTKVVGFQVMAAGGAAGLVALLDAGVAGAMLRLAASAPQACYEAFAAFKDGDPALSSEKEQRLLEADVLMEELGIAGIKCGCDLNGYYGGSPRLPRLALDASSKAKVEKVLVGLRN